MLEDLGEFGFIDKIRQGCINRSENIVKAIGDDSAAFFTQKGKITLVTTDLLVERIHFIRESISGYDLGYKALSVNLSDIAAMGGAAREAFISIAIPDGCSLEYIEDFYGGVKFLASKFNVNILGGDTTGSKEDLIINILVVGAVGEDEMLCRDGARNGDLIFISGCIGDSRAGLYLILNHIKENSRENNYLINAHIKPKPYLEEGHFLATRGYVNSAIDISDGLTSDLYHILKASGVGARIFSETLPISNELYDYCKKFNYDPIDFSLTGGEDYVLLVTIPSDKADSVVQSYFKTFGRKLFQIGEINASENMELVDKNGHVNIINPAGWDHFKPPKNML